MKQYILLIAKLCFFCSIQLNLIAKESIAAAIINQDESVISDVCNKLIVLDKTNFIKKPWAGSQLFEYKNLDAQAVKSNPNWQQIGECYELCACRSVKDIDAKNNPSLVTFEDGSHINLLTLLDACGKYILGDKHLKKYGSEIPLLPKSLNIGQLLSVQAHNEGNPELYIVINAEPGARLFVGFKKTIPNIQRFKNVLEMGRKTQEKFLNCLVSDIDQNLLYRKLSDYFAKKQSIENITELYNEIKGEFIKPDSKYKKVIKLLQELQIHYCKTLDLLNAIEVHNGDIIYNAAVRELANDSGELENSSISRDTTDQSSQESQESAKEIEQKLQEQPEQKEQHVQNKLLEQKEQSGQKGSEQKEQHEQKELKEQEYQKLDGQEPDTLEQEIKKQADYNSCVPCAEIHALGNPENKEILVLEIRKPGPTYRLWDNVRFPLRELDTEIGINKINTKATKAEQFIVEPKLVCDNLYDLVSNKHFDTKKIELNANQELSLTTDGTPKILLSISGQASFYNKDDQIIGNLSQAETAIVPAQLSNYKIKAGDFGTTIILVSLTY